MTHLVGELTGISRFSEPSVTGEHIAVSSFHQSNLFNRPRAHVKRSSLHADVVASGKLS